MKVVFLLTGNCQEDDYNDGVEDPGFKVYETIASTSSGQLYDLNKNDISEVLALKNIFLFNIKF